MPDPLMNPPTNDPNQTPKSIWQRPWSGAARTLGWLAILAAAVFILVFTLGVAGGGRTDFPGLLLFSLLAAVVVTVLMAGAVWLVRWLRSWRNFRRALFAFACLVTVVALAYAVENWRGRRVWMVHRAAWEAKGEKFTIAALAPAPVPDDKNFARTPLLKASLEYTQGPKGVVWTDTNALARLQRTRHDLASKNNDHELLVLGNLDSGTFADLASCRQFYRGNTNYPQPVKPGSPAEDILVALAKFNPEFAELRAATAGRPQSRFPIQYDQEPSWAILLPHLAQLKGLTSLTHLRAVAALEAGRPAEAFADLKVGFRISDSLRDEPLLIDHLVRIACLGIDLQTVREGLVRHAWTDAQLAEIESHLRSLNLLAEYRLAIRGERALSTSGLDWVRRQGFRGTPRNYLGDDGGSLAASGFNLLPSGWYYQNMLAVSKACQEHLLDVVDDQHRRVSPSASDQGAHTVEVMPRGPYTFFAKMLLPALGKAVRKTARMQTFVDAARIACALERYRLAKGKLPDALGLLVPGYLAAVPADVVDGKPLRYRLDPDGGYLLYSVGWNGVDDDGEVVLEDGKKATLDVSQGDWVWRMPAKPGQP
jgi:hypothetical protein